MEVKTGMRKVAQPWISLVGVLELGGTHHSSQSQAIQDVFANYQYGLEVMAKVAAFKVDFLRSIVGGFSPSQLERFVRVPGASQVIWWAREADHGTLPDRGYVDYLVQRSMADDLQTPEVVADELPYFDRLAVDWGCAVDVPGDVAGRRSVARIAAAIDLIRRRSGRAHALVSQHSGLIVARSTQGTRDPLYSASNVRAIGISLICNADATTVSVEEVADRIWHETIHDLIHKIQFSSKLFINAAIAEQRVVSPWSGIELSVTSYLHACFVWYGLRNFWSALAPGEASEGEARRLGDIASAGFRRKGLVDQLAQEQRRLIEPEALDAIELMQRRVLANAA